MLRPLRVAVRIVLTRLNMAALLKACNGNHSMSDARTYRKVGPSGTPLTRFDPPRWDSLIPHASVEA
jgi:hypothetical protein